MRQRQAVLVDRSREEVYRYLADPRNLPEWVDPVAEVDVLSPDPDDLEPTPEHTPVRFRQLVDAEGESVGHEGEIEADPDAGRVWYRFENRDGRLSTTFRLEPAAGGTRVVEELEVPLTSIWTKVLAPFLYFANRSRLKRQLDDLKRALEARPV